MNDPASSETRLRTTFNIKVNGRSTAISTVGQAHQFLTSVSAVEWMEFKSLHDQAMTALQAAADNAIMTVQATNAVRTLFVQAKLL
ncbi:conserved hypothetical protein [Bradyrhizobium sp. STM 3843]|uniref:hypothetical protein n=1 Tax=unclassified Bradyrhizobium TaxID=2631580 RepID=UPI00024031DC|nr:hypothetical protein [Bradyrhizobium sp. STM 3843]CCE08255.1 conserved hypothetical protein [Bradyrhizobium sp. STM 3843]